MSWISLIQLAIFWIILISLMPILGRYMAAVFSGKKTRAHVLLFPLERLCYRLGGVDAQQELTWTAYAKALFYFNFVGFIFLWLLLLTQNLWPFNPQHFPALSLSLAFNIAISFVTNTNWQSYAGETTLSYVSQLVGLTVQNFLSAATGMTVLLVLIRGLTGKMQETVGNFWVDLVRSLVYILLPLSCLLALLLISQGVIQTVDAPLQLETLEKQRQMIPLGPVASQLAIKQIGTNGGGFFNANSSHPFENPTALTNFLQNLAILLIPAALLYTYSLLINSKRQGWLLFGVMFTFYLGGMALASYAEQRPNPILKAYPLYEGKELRLGTPSSLLWAVTTTDTGNGSVNVMHSSLSPLAGGVTLFNILLGGVIFGGIGVGLCSMLMMVLLTVFLAGLMVGRTPEYLGKKIEKREIQWVMAAVLIPSLLILIGTGISCVLPAGLASLGHTGPHGLSEILYAFASCANNNGSSFASLEANTFYYNSLLGFVILVGRVAIVLPSLALGGLLAKKKISPPSAGTFSTDSLLFASLLFFVILIMGALTFFPALALGPIMEHLLMLDNRSF